MPEVAGMQSPEVEPSPVTVCPHWCESTHAADDEHHLLPDLARRGDAAVDVVQNDAEHASPSADVFWRGQTVFQHLSREVCGDLLDVLPQLTTTDLRDLATVIESAELWLAHQARAL